MDNNWMPVTKQLPRDGQECWTFQKWHEEKVGLHRFHADRWVDMKTGRNNLQLGWDHITHWQPLVRPEAPGDEE